jgi:hypothetical protein
VHQSRPNSVVNSAVNSTGNSPTPSRSTSPTRGVSSNPSAHSSTALLPGRPIRDTRTFSASSSAQSLNQISREPTVPVIRVASQMSVASDFSATSEMPQQAYSPKLRPSVAELNGRLKHAPVDMSLNLPPSPTGAGFPATYRPDSVSSSAGPYSGRSSGGSLAAFQGQQPTQSSAPPPPKKRRSNQRFSSATYHILEEQEDDHATLGSPERTHTTAEVIANDPKAETRSLRASIVEGAARRPSSSIDEGHPHSLRVPSAGRGRPETRTVFEEEMSSGASSSGSEGSTSRAASTEIMSERHLAASEGPSSSAASSDGVYTYSGKPLSI